MVNGLRTQLDLNLRTQKFGSDFILQQMIKEEREKQIAALAPKPTPVPKPKVTIKPSKTKQFLKGAGKFFTEALLTPVNLMAKAEQTFAEAVIPEKIQPAAGVNLKAFRKEKPFTKVPGKLTERVKKTGALEPTELPEVERPEAIIQTWGQTFLPSKAAIYALEKIRAIAPSVEEEEIAEKYPGSYVLTKAAGWLANFYTVGKILPAMSLSKFIPFSALAPAAARALDFMVHGFATGATTQFFDTALNQFKEGKFDPGELVSESARTGAYVGLVAAPMAAASSVIRIGGAGLIAGNVSLLESAIEDGEISGEDATEALVNSVVMMLLVAAGTFKAEEKYKIQEWHDMNSNMLRTAVQSRHPDWTPKQVEHQIILVQTLGNSFAKEIAPIQQIIEAPNTFRISPHFQKAPTKIQTQYIQSLRGNIKSGIPLNDAIAKSNMLLTRLMDIPEVKVPEVEIPADLDVTEVPEPKKINVFTSDGKTMEKTIQDQVQESAEIPDEAGFVKLPSKEELDDILTGMKAKVDIVAPFDQIGAHDTGMAIKNYYTRHQTEREKGKDWVQQVTKLDLTPDEYINATFVAAQPGLFKPMSDTQRKRMSPLYQSVRKYFDEHAEQLKEREIIVDKWPQSMINRLQEENKQLLGSIEKSRTKAYRQFFERGLTDKSPAERRQEINDKIKANNSVIRFLKEKKIQYVHLPLRVWMEDLLKEQPFEGPRVLNRFFGRRKTVDLREFANYLINEGIIKHQDLDIRNVVGAYSDKIGRIYALSDIFSNAKKDNLIKLQDLAPDNWVSAPLKLVPELKGYKVHPAFMEYLERFLEKIDKGYKLGRIMGGIKMMQFYNPIILPLYDIYQGFWAGTFRNIKVPKYMKDAIEQIWKKDDTYWEAWESGAFSQPYIPPFENFKKEIEMAKQLGWVNKTKEYLKQNYKIPTDLFYKIEWQLAWSGDRLVRLMTYNYLKGKSFSTAEAGEFTAFFHGDYARLPPRARRVLNRIFFTPTFKVVMTELQLSMMVSAGRVLTTAGKTTDTIKRDKLLAAGLLFLVGGILIRHYIMKKLGFETDDFGVRYVKTFYDEEEGRDKELVIYFSAPDNIWLRYWHRWKTFPQNPKQLEGFLNRIKWDLHPLYLLSINLLSNKKPNGEVIYNPYDNPAEQFEDEMKFIIQSLVRIIEQIPNEEKEKEAFEQLQEEVGNIWAFILKGTSLQYIREGKERTDYYKQKGFYNNFKDFLFRDPPKTDEEEKIRIENFQKKMEKLQQELETK